jgi:hypothetical protein
MLSIIEFSVQVWPWVADHRMRFPQRSVIITLRGSSLYYPVPIHFQCWRYLNMIFGTGTTGNKFLCPELDKNEQNIPKNFFLNWHVLEPNTYRYLQKHKKKKSF